MMQWDGMQDMHQECINKVRPPVRKCRKSYWLDDLLDVLRSIENRARRGYARAEAWIDEVWLPRAMERITGKAADRVCAWGIAIAATVLAVLMCCGR